MIRIAGGIFAAVMLGAASPLPQVAAPAGDVWPCEAPPPADPTLGTLWPGAKGDDWRSDSGVAGLVAEVAPRSVPVQAATARIVRYAGERNDRSIAMARLAAGLVETLTDEQQAIVAGIRRFNTRQAMLAKRMEAAYAKLDSAPAPTPGATPTASGDAGALEEQVGWDTRIFEDRQRLLPVMCKLPATLSSRLVALVGAARAATR